METEHSQLYFVKRKYITSISYKAAIETWLVKHCSFLFISEIYRPALVTTVAGNNFC